ncbi:Sodium-dependent phosphate transport protein 1 [Aphelenchoides bicaudatus]|nr:Sodium-dependent phosphate transport protein 1 [Aphelenchoides bicaudatus]
MLSKDKVADADSGKVNILSSSSSDEGGFFFGHKTRFVIMILSAICLSAIMANSLTLNFTVICMVDEIDNSTLTQTNSTEPPPMFSEAQQSWLFAAIAIGTIIGTLPINYVCSNFGVRKSFTVYGLISAVSTCLIPMSVNAGFYLVFIMRVLQGFSVATSFPAMGSIISEWSTTKRSGFYIALLSIHLQMGSVITMPLSGELCESRFGWPAVYYLLGVATFVLFIMFFFFYCDSAEMHRNVSSKELQVIHKNKPHLIKSDEDEKSNVPYREMFTDLPVLGCVLSAFSSNVGYNIFVQFGPVYLHEVLGFDVQKTGFIAAVPALICIAVKFAAAPVSDTLPISARGRVILFATVSQCCMGCCFIALAFLPSGMPLVAQALFTGAIVFSGLNCVGVIKSVQLISGKYAYILMATFGFTNSIIVLILPFVVTFVAPDNTREEWRRILVFIAALVITAILFFDWTAEATPRPWSLSKAAYTQKDQNLVEAAKVNPVCIDALTLSTDQEKKEQV